MQENNSKQVLISKIIAEEQISYDGSQIMSHWAYKRFGIEGDSIVAFKGKCNINPQNIVDLEDKMKGAKIMSPMMLHFIIEHFHMRTFVAVLLQRLLAGVVKDIIGGINGTALKREGDDLYHNGRKLTISVASASVHSAKIHFGINIITPAGIDVPVTSLSELDITADKITDLIITAYMDEYKKSLSASYKVTDLSQR